MNYIELSVSVCNVSFFELPFDFFGLLEFSFLFDARVNFSILTNKLVCKSLHLLLTLVKCFSLSNELWNGRTTFVLAQNM